ncbi:MAG: hypothetical protein AB7E51_14975 [Pseudodesulfovibrio sp.]|uniref:hypothetical protein n=1 Tax=Pseudodesulfovibrio sp. TaxID=2035812 RepID=UPI003D0AD77F
MYLAHIALPLFEEEEIAAEFCETYLIGGRNMKPAAKVIFWRMAPTLSDPAGLTILAMKFEVASLKAVIADLKDENREFRKELKDTYRELSRLIDKPFYVGTAEDILAIAMINDGHFVADLHQSIKTVMFDATERRHDVDKYKGVVKAKIALSPDSDNCFITTHEIRAEVPAHATVGKVYFDGQGVDIDHNVVNSTGLLRYFKEAEEEAEQAA